MCYWGRGITVCTTTTTTATATTTTATATRTTTKRSKPISPCNDQAITRNLYIANIHTITTVLDSGGNGSFCRCYPPLSSHLPPTTPHFSSYAFMLLHIATNPCPFFYLDFCPISNPGLPPCLVLSWITPSALITYHGIITYPHCWW